MAHPGQVFYLPRDASEDISKGDRPHVLLSLCPPGSDVVTVAYGSTKATEAHHGAESVLVVPDASSYRGTGLRHPTYIYPSRLVSLAPDRLGAPAGRLIDEMPLIRAALRRALGLGTGVTRAPNARGANRRGRVVELTPEMAREWEVRYGLVVTEPGYSRTGYQQTIVPLLDDECEVRGLDLVLAADSRFLSLGPLYTRPILAVTMVSTVYQPDHIARYLDLVCDMDLMRQVDAALALHFGI
jgi:hypothetical protein